MCNLFSFYKCCFVVNLLWNEFVHKYFRRYVKSTFDPCPLSSVASCARALWTRHTIFLSYTGGKADVYYRISALGRIEWLWRELIFTPPPLRRYSVRYLAAPFIQFTISHLFTEIKKDTQTALLN